MNANEFKAICRWLITLCLAANLFGLTQQAWIDSLLNDPTCVSVTKPAHDPQPGLGN